MKVSKTSPDAAAAAAKAAKTAAAPKQVANKEASSAKEPSKGWAAKAPVARPHVARASAPPAPISPPTSLFIPPTVDELVSLGAADVSAAEAAEVAAKASTSAEAPPTSSGDVAPSEVVEAAPEAQTPDAPVVAPVVTPEPDTSRADAVALEASLLPLTSKPTSAYADGSLDAKLDVETLTRKVAGNLVTMLFDGINSFSERNKMIDGAKETICLQTFIFNSDETGRDLANRLAAKAQEGVKVRVIYDAAGSSRADPKMFEMMKQAGVELRPYGEKWKVWDVNNRWHEKHLIVDGKASVEGGMNIANEYALGGSGKMVFSRGDGKTGTEAWRDTDVKLEGPAVTEAMKMFARSWDELGTKLTDADRTQLFPELAPHAEGSSVRVIESRPRQNPTVATSTIGPHGPRGAGGIGVSNVTRRAPGDAGSAQKLYLNAISAAKKSINIENAYFLPTPELRQALVAAAKRGVTVNVLTNGRESSDMGFVSDAARYFYDDLIKAGVSIREKVGGTLHSKTATFDGEYSIIGSVNLNGRSANLDTEDAVGVTDNAVAEQLQQRFQEGVAQSRLVTLDELKHESFATNLKQWALSRMAWTF